MKSGIAEFRKFRDEVDWLVQNRPTCENTAISAIAGESVEQANHDVHGEKETYRFLLGPSFLERGRPRLFCGHLTRAGLTGSV